MIANVHRYRGALPGSRADLYAEICQVLLWRRQEAKRLPAELRGDQKEVVLQKVAFTMMRRRVRDLTRRDLLSLITAVLPRVSTALTAEDFLADATTSGLLIERENDLYTFAHQTFQEYLAATYVHEKAQTSVLAEAAGEPWWRETTLLYAARADAGPIVEACLARGSVAALALAFDCADQASELAPQLRARLDGLLADARQPGTDPERRRLMAGVMATRHLRGLVRTSDGVQVCPRPITTDLYWLFLQDARSQGEPRVPDCPDALDEASGKTAVGMRGSDALAFVAWLNNLTGGDSAYRLPTRQEAEDLAAGGGLPALRCGIWLAPDGDPSIPQLWAGPDGLDPKDHPCTIGTKLLCRHLEADVQTTPLLVSLLLVRSRILLRALWPDDPAKADGRIVELGLDLVGAFVHEVDRDLQLARELNLDRDLETAPDHDLELDLSRDLEYAHNLARQLATCMREERTLDHSSARELTRVLDRALVRGLALVRSLVVRGLDLVDGLNRARDVDPASHIPSGTGERDVARILDLALARDSDPASEPDPAHPVDLASLVGSALFRSLSEALPAETTSQWPPSSSDNFQSEFSRTLVSRSKIENASQVVWLDAVTSRVQFALDTLENLRSGPNPGPARTRTTGVIDWLRDTVLPTLTRQHRLDLGRSAAIRLAALCLAAEPGSLLDVPGLSFETTFHEIATGITLLERRLSGDVPATESILVALA